MSTANGGAVIKVAGEYLEVGRAPGGPVWMESWVGQK